MAVGICSGEHVDGLCRHGRGIAELCRRRIVLVAKRNAGQEAIKDLVERVPFKERIAAATYPIECRIHRDSIDVENAAEIIEPRPEASLVAARDLVGHLE